MILAPTFACAREKQSVSRDLLHIPSIQHINLHFSFDKTMDDSSTHLVVQL